MAEITAAMVKELRERTSVGMMDCKKALNETNGDVEAAVTLLRQRGIIKAENKAGRVATEGVVAAATANGGKTVALVEINCETDFVARNEGFLAFVGEVTQFVAEKVTLTEGSSADLAGLDFKGGAKFEDVVKEQIFVIGEKVDPRRFVRWTSEGTLGHYIHLGGQIGALVEVEGSGDLAGLARDLAVHVAAFQPACLSREDMPAEAVAKEKEALLGADDLKSKPENVREKMVEGRLGKFFEQVVMLEQPFVKDQDKKVGDVVKAAGATVKRFVRFTLGEGLEKKSDDFAAEVAAMTGAGA